MSIFFKVQSGKITVGQAWSKIRPASLQQWLQAGGSVAAVGQARKVGGSGQNLAKKGCTRKTGRQN